MAQKVLIQLVDDVDGSLIEEGDGETVSFALDGQAYTIDLSNKNADSFRGLFQDHIAVAKKVGRKGGGASGRASRKANSPGTNTAEVRAWARENGWPDLGDRGRIPAEVQTAYDAR